MACSNCKQSWFWEKIGRCQRCINQLMVLSVSCWLIWLLFFKQEPRDIKSIALIMAGLAFSILLFLHLWMKFIVIPLRKNHGK